MSKKASPGAFRAVRVPLVAWGRHTWRRPGVRHLVAAVNRYNDRLGTQFAGSLTYFSFLALVPILMVAFSIAGFVLASRPSMLTGLRDEIAKELPSGLSEVVSGILDTAVDARLTVGVIGLIVALYSGISWMGNLRSAIQALWRPEFDSDNEIRAESLLRYYWKSLRYLGFFGLAILLSLLLTTAGTWAQTFILELLGLDRVSWLRPVLTVGPILVALLTDIVVFALLYRLLSPKDLTPARRPLIRGAVMVSVAFEVLKLGFTVALPLLLSSTTARLFGQVIGLLIFINLVATVVLFVAAWIATTPGSRSAGPDPHPEREARRIN